MTPKPPAPLPDASYAPIAARVERVLAAIAEAAEAAARAPSEIKLVAVSKRQPLAAIEAALKAHVRRFGESTVQEALPKIAAHPEAEWHFIGHLQANKARFLPGRVSWLHSLDSLATARRLRRLCADAGTTLNVLVQVNVTGAASQRGVAPAALAPFLDALLAEPTAPLALRGLMAIGPAGASEAAARAAFARVRALKVECVARFALEGFTELSMGMSEDYRAAIAEGATFVRIGSALFGER